MIEFKSGYIRRDYKPDNYPIGPLTTIIMPEETIHEDTDKIGILDTQYVNQAWLDDAFHPNLLGASTGIVAVLDNYTLDELLAVPDRANESVTDEELDGVSVKHIAYDRAVGSHIDLWIAPSHGFSVLKFQATGPSGASQVMTSTSRQFPPGVWYPRVVENVTLAADGRVTSHELATVEAADFSKPPGDTRFSLLTMDVPVGTVISDTAVEKVWNGRELVPRYEDPEQLQQEAEAVQMAVEPGPNYALWAVVLGLVAVLLAVWRMRAAG